MRTRRILALAVLLCAASTAQADVLQASSTTVVTAGKAWKAGEAQSTAPVTELITLSASEMQTSYGVFEATLSAWASGDLAGTPFWQNGASPKRATADVDVGYLKGDLFGRKLSFRLGRQLIVEGGARMTHVDGIQLVLKPGMGFGLSGFYGAPVAPRFEFSNRGSTLQPGALQANNAYGGRLSWGRGALFEVGASVSMADAAGGEVSRREVGLDLRLAPIHAVEINAGGFYSLYDAKLGQGQVAVDWHLTRAWALVGDYQHLQADLLLARNSVLAVFVGDSRDDLGGGVRWTPSRALAVEGYAWYLSAGDGTGSRFRGKGTWTPAAGQTYGAEAEILKLPDNGFVTGRLFASRAYGKADLGLDLWLYKYDRTVNGEDKSLGGTVTGGFAFAPAWRATVAASGGVDPYFKTRFDVMAKLVWNQTHIREVR